MSGLLGRIPNKMVFRFCYRRMEDPTLNNQLCKTFKGIICRVIFPQNIGLQYIGLKHR